MLKTAMIIVLICALILSALGTCGCSELYSTKTPLGIKVQPGRYSPDLNITDAKYLAMAECADLDPMLYIGDLTVQITAPGSEEIPWAGDRPMKYIWGTYQPSAFRVVVNEDQTTLAHEIGHYLMHMMYGFRHCYRHDPFSLPTKCGNPIDHEYNKKVDASR